MSERLTYEEGLKLLNEMFPEGPPAEPLVRFRQLFGECLWDILSNNHELILPVGRVVYLGSFRGSARLVAEFLGYCDEMDYMRFYCGTKGRADRSHVSSVYRYIFNRLKELGIDWFYSFPQTHMIPIPKLRDRPEGFENYDPSGSLQATEEEQQEREQLAKLKEFLEEQNQRSIEEAKTKPPPQTAQAYREVIGRWPAGWPPWDEN